MSKSRASFVSIAFLSLAMALSPLVAEAGKGSRSGGSSYRSSPSSGSYKPMPPSNSGGSSQRGSSGFGSFGSNAKPAPPPEKSSQNGGFGSFGSSSKSTTASNEQPKQRVTVIAPTANASTPSGSAMMHDLNSQTAKSNASKVLQAGAVPSTGYPSSIGSRVNNTPATSTFGYNKESPRLENSSTMPSRSNPSAFGRSNTPSNSTPAITRPSNVALGSIAAGAILGHVLTQNSHANTLPNNSAGDNVAMPNPIALPEYSAGSSRPGENSDTAQSNAISSQVSSGGETFLVVLFIMLLILAIGSAVVFGISHISKPSKSTPKKGKYTL